MAKRRKRAILSLGRSERFGYHINGFIFGFGLMSIFRHLCSLGFEDYFPHLKLDYGQKARISVDIRFTKYKRRRKRSPG